MHTKIIDGRLWIRKEGRDFLGFGRVELLKGIQEHGSISKAAKAMKMSYKAAWDAMDAMNKLSNEPLLEKNVGGKGGGGTTLTIKAKELIAIYGVLYEKHQMFLEAMGKHIDSYEALHDYVYYQALRTTARNNLFCVVDEIVIDEPNAQVTMILPHNEKVHSIITRRSVEELKIHKGQGLYAIIKSSWIELEKVKGAEPLRNYLKGSVTCIEAGKIDTMFTLRVGETSLQAVISNVKASELDCVVGEVLFMSIGYKDIILGSN